MIFQAACHSSVDVDAVWTALVVRAHLPVTARFDHHDHDDDDGGDDHREFNEEYDDEYNEQLW